MSQSYSESHKSRFHILIGSTLRRCCASPLKRILLLFEVSWSWALSAQIANAYWKSMEDSPQKQLSSFENQSTVEVVQGQGLDLCQSWSLCGEGPGTVASSLLFFSSSFPVWIHFQPKIFFKKPFKLVCDLRNSAGLLIPQSLLLYFVWS